MNLPLEICDSCWLGHTEPCEDVATIEANGANYADPDFSNCMCRCLVEVGDWYGALPMRRDMEELEEVWGWAMRGGAVGAKWRRAS